MSSPLKQIRKHCIACSAGFPKEVRLCPITDCPLYELRFGHNPARKGVGAKDGVLRPKSVGVPKEIGKEEVLEGLGREAV